MKFPGTLPSLLKELVAIPSVTPGGGDTGGTVAGEAAMAAYVADLLRAMGGDVSIQTVQPGRPNAIARFTATRRGAPTLAIVPHLDTVGVAGMTVAPFKPVIRAGRLYGRGACDTKGPMAAALWALRRWLRHGDTRASKTIVFAATMGEEELSVGASALCAGGFRADFAVALEPTDLKIVHAAKGVLRTWVESQGRAAHGATPQRGRNAVYALTPFLAACRDTLAPRFARTRHLLLGGASLNLGIVRGGDELNVVPDAARAGLDARTHPAFDNDEALAHITAAARGLRLKVRVHRQGPPFALPRNHAGVRALAGSARGFAAVPWFSDANVFNAHGTPAVAFGPGSIRQAHTADEFIALAALEDGARAFEKFYLHPSS